MGRKKEVDVTEKYIKVRVKDPKLFDENSFRLIEIEPDVSAVVGDIDGAKVIQSYLFNKENDWDIEKAKEWVENNKSKVYFGSRILNNITYITAVANLVPKPINMQDGERFNKDDVKIVEASLQDKYYFYTEGVHEGPNLNGQYFFRDELTENYLSAAGQLIDYEHMRDHIIGFTKDTQLVKTNAAGDLAIGVNGILNRTSPYMTMRVNDEGHTRDDVIKRAFFEGRLGISMECLFDTLKCTKCGYESNDYLEFDHHMFMNHSNDHDAYYGLVGVDFIGWGITMTPADPKAEIFHLRTAEDGELKDIVDASARERFGGLAENVFLAKNCAFSSKFYDFSEKNVEKIEKNKEKSTKKDKESDIDSKPKEDSNNLGGSRMFKLMEKAKGLGSLNDIFVMAQKTLKDYLGDNKLSEEDVNAFSDELKEVVASVIKVENFEISDIYSFTKQDKLDAITAARDEEKAEATEQVEEKDKEIEKLKAQLSEMTDKNKELQEKMADIENAAKEKDKQNKIDALIAGLKSDGINLTPVLEEGIRVLVSKKMDEDEAVDLEDIKKSFTASFKKEILFNASAHNGDAAFSGKDDENTLQKRLDKIHKKETE